MGRVLTKYDITQCALYKCRTKDRLSKLLTLEPGGLKRIQNVISYHSFLIDKKTPGEKREITAPGRVLKAVQSRILFLLQRVERPEWLISGEQGKSYITNGKAHLNSDYMLAVDIRKFYDNCKRDRVYRFFHEKLLTAPDVTEILTDIVTYHGTIPTGCPTSQMIAYYAYSDMFGEISVVAKEFGCTFTLYVDDMTFSSSTRFDPQLLTRAVDRILRKYGHRPKYKKVRYYAKNEPKPVTGTIITPNHTFDVPNCLQRKIYENFQTIKSVRSPSACTEEECHLIQSLKGQIGAAHCLDETRFPEIERLTDDIIADTQSVSHQMKKQNSKTKGKIRIPQ